MKKYLALTLIAVFTMINATATFAQYNSSKLDEKINRYISYPYLATNDMHGTVAIKFAVNENGKLDVQHIFSENEYLQDFVERRLKKIILPLDDVKIGTTQDIVISFKKEGNGI